MASLRTALLCAIATAAVLVGLTAFRPLGARYPVGGIKLPTDGVIHVNEQDFTAGCGPKP